MRQQNSQRQPAWSILRRAMSGHTPQVAAWLRTHRGWNVTPRYLNYLMSPPNDVERRGFLQRADDLRAALEAVHPEGARILENWFQGGKGNGHEPEESLLNLQANAVDIARFLRRQTEPNHIEPTVNAALAEVINLRDFCEKLRAQQTQEEWRKAA